MTQQCSTENIQLVIRDVIRQASRC